MKTMYRFLAVGALLLSASFMSEAQSIEEALKEYPAYYCSNHTSYRFKDVADTPAPEGYKPFYISHMARHGSRFDSKNKTLERTLGMLERLDADNLLTKEGKRLLELERRFYIMQKDNPGMLSFRGREEHAKLGNRMYDRFTEVFTNPERPNVNAVSTTVIRSITSMSSCTLAMRTKAKKNKHPLHFSMSYGSDPDSILFAGGDYYGAVRIYDALEDSISIDFGCTDIMSKIVKNRKKAAKLVGEEFNFTDDLFGTMSFFGPSGIDELNPALWFTAREMYMHSRHRNARVYCFARQQYDNGVPTIGVLLKHIIAQADSAIAGNGVCANLRFAHDTQMGVLLSLMGEEGMNGIYKPDEIDKYFCSGIMIPMAVNMEIVFYKNESGDVLVKVLHNEEERRLVGLEPFSGPYYRWDELKKYWETRCSGTVPIEIRK